MMSLFQEVNDKQSEKLSEDASKVRDLLLSKFKITEGKSLHFLSHSFSGFIKIFFLLILLLQVTEVTSEARKQVESANTNLRR